MRAMDFPITVRIADWVRDREMLRGIRSAVFIVEQQVPEALEWDEHDCVSVHVLALENGVPVGTARLLPDGHIGRMAVVRDRRRRGAGRAMLERLIGIARERGDTVLRLHAQTHAIPFYERSGFVAHGDEFTEAGIPHRGMMLALRKTESRRVPE